MFRRVSSVAIIALMIGAAPVSADERRPQSSGAKPGSGKRVAWTIIGAAAGFGAGVFLGLHAFDDAINSDRKVWMSAIAGAAAGGVAGAVLSRNVARTPAVSGAAITQTRDRVPDVSWTSALRKGAAPPIAAIEPPRSGGAGLGTENAHDR